MTDECRQKGIMLSKDDVLAVAKLSRLELAEPQLEKFQLQLENVLKLFEEVQGIDVDGVAETSQVTGLQNVTREDIVKPFVSENLLINTPIRKGSNIVVPKIIDPTTPRLRGASKS